MIRFPSLCSRNVILLRGNGRRPDESHFLRPPKLVLEGALHGTFPPPKKIARRKKKEEKKQKKEEEEKEEYNMHTCIALDVLLWLVCLLIVRFTIRFAPPPLCECLRLWQVCEVLEAAKPPYKEME